MIAYHFPPLAGSSGIQRTLRFVQQLPDFGWEPLVLTVRPQAYERTSPDLLADVPPATVVRRTFALDAARHLAIGGRHVAAWARPDRWRSWRLNGVRTGLRMIDAYAPDALFSTYPIPTAHTIGAELHARSGLPWIADFRDPMAQDGYPANPLTWQSFKQVEERAVHGAARCLFTTPGAVRMYRQRYPDAADRMLLLENGYDEESFAAVEPTLPAQPLNPGATTLVHSGIVYPSARDPRPLFAALGAMKQAGELDRPRLVFRFRAAVHDDLLKQLAAQHGVDEYVQICPPVAYRDALAEMLRADGLLLMQAANCNDQVPAKAYEYLRARRPVLCLADPAGDTVRVLNDAGIERSAALDDATAIRNLLHAFARGESGGWLARDEAVVQASRRGRSATLAAVLDSLDPPAGRAERP